MVDEHQDSRGDRTADVLEALSAFDMIESALREEEKVADVSSFEFPVAELLRLIPSQYLKDASPESISGETVTLAIPDLFAKLAQGRVALRIADLAYFVPSHLLFHAAYEDPAEVVLPLPVVVRAVGMAKLQGQMPTQRRHYDIDMLQDPFAESAAAEAGGAAKPPAPPPVPEAEPVESAPAAAEEASVEPPVESAAGEPAASVFDMIEEVLGEEEPEEPGENSFTLELADVVRLMPARHLCDGVRPDTMGPGKVTLNVSELYDKLAHGRVTLSVSDVAFYLPTNVVTHAAHEDRTTLIEFPLRLVVKSVGMDKLIARTASRPVRQYATEGLDDPFKRPEEKPIPPPAISEKPVAEAPPEKVAVPQPTPAEPEVKPPEPPAMAEAPAPTPPPAEAVIEQGLPQEWKPSREAEIAEQDLEDTPGNVNINSASAAELRTLEGVDGELAGRILAHRETQGPFNSVFDLLKVDGIDRARFKQITGMSFAGKRYHRRRRLASLLKMPAEDVTNIQRVAERMAAKSGFAGCVISDRDGLLLAQSGAGEMAEGLSAVVPRLVRQVRDDMNAVGAGHVDSISVCISGRMITVVASRNVALTAIHEESGVMESELSLIRKVGKELAWILSRRAYVGK